MWENPHRYSIDSCVIFVIAEGDIGQFKILRLNNPGFFVVPKNPTVTYPASTKTLERKASINLGNGFR